MRGNASGRNGSGVAKPFYCFACDKNHSASVEKVGISETGEVICNKQYLKMMAAKFEAQKNQIVGYGKLLSKRHDVMMLGVDGLNARVEFVKCAFEYDLVKEITSGGDCQRQFSSCFEMNDAELVIAEVIKASGKKYWLRYSLIKNLGMTLFKSWEDTATAC